MFSLKLERGRYLRVRAGTEKCDVVSTFHCPVTGEIFCGAIIPLGDEKRYCYALVGDTYAKIAAREGVGEAELKKLNGDRPVYPAARVWLP